MKHSKRVQEDKNYIEVMGKIFATLEYFVENSNKQKSLMFSEIATALPFARTTVHRILYSLEKLGYVERDEVRPSYRLAGKFFELAGGAIHYRRLLAVARSEMQTLLLRFGETVNLGVLEILSTVRRLGRPYLRIFRRPRLSPSSINSR